MSGGDVEPGKLFIGGLSWKTTKEGLLEYFKKYGEITEATVSVDAKDNFKPRGFGFVTFADPASAERALAVPNHVLDDKQIDPKPAMSKPPPAQSSPSVHTNHTKKVFVGGLPSDLDKDELKRFLEDKVNSVYTGEIGVKGKVLDVELKFDRETSRMKGFGFVTFDNEEVVERICGFHDLKGKTFEVKKADPKHHKLPYGAGQYQRQAVMNNPYAAVYEYNGGWTQQRSQYPGGGYDYSYNQPVYQTPGYGGQAGSYASSGSYGGSGYGGSSGYGGASTYDSFSQPSGQQQQQQQQTNSYPDQTYSNTYSTSRNPDSYPTQQQQHYPQNYSQLYGSSTGTPGGRGQQTPQNSYTFAGRMP